MFVIPVSPTLSVDSEQNSYKSRRHPSFGLQLSQSAEEVFTHLKTELSKKAKHTPQQKALARMIRVIDELKERDFDQIRLDITEVADGAKKVLQFKLEKLSHAVNGVPLQINRFCDKKGGAVADTLSELFLDKRGKMLNPLALGTKIVNDAIALCGKNLQITLLPPPLRKPDAAVVTPPPVIIHSTP